MTATNDGRLYLNENHFSFPLMLIIGGAQIDRVNQILAGSDPGPLNGNLPSTSARPGHASLGLCALPPR